MVAGRNGAGDATPASRRTPQQRRRRAFTVVLALVAMAVGIAGLVPEPDALADQTEILTSAPPATAAPTTVAPTTTSTAAPTTTTATEVPTTVEAPTSTAKPTTTTAAPTTTTTTAAAPPSPPSPPSPPPAVAGTAAVAGTNDDVLACLRRRESGGNYQAVSSTGLYFGAYQFMISTWDSTAGRAGRPDLIGVRPDRASPADQDAMALALLDWQGKAPWNGAC